MHLAPMLGCLHEHGFTNGLQPYNTFHLWLQCSQSFLCSVPQLASHLHNYCNTRCCILGSLGLLHNAMYSSSDTDNNIDVYSIANTEKDKITDLNEAKETAGNEAGKCTSIYKFKSKGECQYGLVKD